MQHGDTCICVRCSRSRRTAELEAERPRRQPAEHFSAELVRLRAEGATFRQLAEATGLSVGTVHRLVRGGETMIDPATQDALAAFFAGRPAVGWDDNRPRAARRRLSSTPWSASAAPPTRQSSRLGGPLRRS